MEDVSSGAAVSAVMSQQERLAFRHSCLYPSTISSVHTEN